MDVNASFQNTNNRRPQGTKAVWQWVLRQFSACGLLDFENLRARTATLTKLWSDSHGNSLLWTLWFCAQIWSQGRQVWPTKVILKQWISFPLKWDFASSCQGEDALCNVRGGGQSMVISYYQNNARPQFCWRKNWFVKIQTCSPVFNVTHAWKAFFSFTGMTWRFGRMPECF